jgi:hypothetical protein
VLMLLAALAFPQEAVYTDDEKGFSAALPPGWSVTRGKDAARVLVLTAPAGHAGATCVIAIQPPMKAVVDGQVTLDAFLEEVKKGYPKKFMNFEFGRAEKGRDGEALTLDLYYTYLSGGQRIGQLQRLVWTKTQHASVVFGCLADAFEKERPDFEKYARAFKAGPRK